MERAIAKRKLVNLEAVRLNPVSERLNTGTPQQAGMRSTTTTKAQLPGQGGSTTAAGQGKAAAKGS